MNTKCMKVMGKAILLLAFAAQAAASGFKLDGKARKELEKTIEQEIAQNHAPGLAVGVISGGKVIYAKGFGMANLEAHTKVTPESISRIGSLTKQFTAAAVMVLAEQGKLSLDDTLSKYYPDFPRGNEVTLREMLNHTSGIHPSFGPNSPPSRAQMETLHTAADMIEVLKSYPELYTFDPGTAWRYSNSGYIILGEIVAKVSGVSLNEFMQKNLFSRAGMTMTAMDDPQEIVPNRVSGYKALPDGKGFQNLDAPKAIAAGAGAIRSNVPDMLHWADAFMNGRIVSAAGVKEMTTPGTLKNGKRIGEPGTASPPYGFGLISGELNGHRYYVHNGAVDGYNALLMMYPDDNVAYVVLCNAALGMEGPGPRQGPGSGPGPQFGPGPGPRQGPGPGPQSGPGPRQGPGPQSGPGPGPQRAFGVSAPVRNVEKILNKAVSGE